MIRVTDETPRAELEEAICNMVASARRMHDSPGFYERAHERINVLLDDWRLAPE